MDIFLLNIQSWAHSLFDPATYWQLSPLMLALALAAFSLLFEDVALLIGVVIVHQDPQTALQVFLGLYGGIALGDMLLYAAGRWMNRMAFIQQHMQKPRFMQVIEKLRSNVWMMLIATRAIPASRLPTFVAAGLMRVPMPLFTVIIMSTVLLWTAIVLFVGVNIVEIFRNTFGFSPAWLLVPMLFFILKPLFVFFKPLAK